MSNDLPSHTSEVVYEANKLAENINIEDKLEATPKVAFVHFMLCNMIFSTFKNERILLISS